DDGEGDKKKEERDSGFGARSQTTPIGPLLLDGVATGRGSPDRPRRKRVGLTGSRPAQRPKSKLQRRTAPGGPNSDSCCGIARGRASTCGRCTTASSTGVVRTAPVFGINDAVAEADVSMATPRARSRPERRARRAERPTDDVLDGRGIVELAPAACARGDGVVRQRCC